MNSSVVLLMKHKSIISETFVKMHFAIYVHTLKIYLFQWCYGWEYNAVSTVFVNQLPYSRDSVTYHKTKCLIQEIHITSDRKMGGLFQENRLMGDILHLSVSTPLLQPFCKGPVITNQ